MVHTPETEKHHQETEEVSPPDRDEWLMDLHPPARGNREMEYGNEE